MQIKIMRNDAGIVTGFEIPMALLSGRHRACRIVARVAGARVVRKPRPFRLGPSDFCAFTVDGVPFLIIEPFGDNDCYWVVAKEPDPAAAPLIDRVRRTFEATRFWL